MLPYPPWVYIHNGIYASQVPFVGSLPPTPMYRSSCCTPCVHIMYTGWVDGYALLARGLTVVGTLLGDLL